MKIYLSIISVLLATSPIFGQASIESNQDTTRSRTPFHFPIVQNEVDEFEGTSKLLVSRLENWVFDKINENALGFDIAVGLIDDLYILYYYGAKSCLKQGESKISLLLENGEIVDLGYYGDIDCKSTVRKAKFLFVGPSNLLNPLPVSELVNLQKENIDKVLSSPIKRVRIYTTEGYSEYQTYDVEKYLENIRKWQKNSIKEADGNFERNFAKEQYSKFIKKYKSGENGAIFYRIPYDYVVPLDDENLLTIAKAYLKASLDSFDENIDIRAYYDYYRGNTKYALMDMIRVLQNER